jgi:RNA polymerase sigma-70 factor, ECF subfamily
MGTVARRREHRDARREALGEMIERRHGRMVAVARRVLGDDDAARDAVQDACVHALRALDTFEDRSRLSTWFHRIVVNAALMRLRRERRAPVESLEVFASGESPGTEVGDSAEATVERGQVCALVRRAIEETSPAHRTILQLRDLYDLDTRETARRLRVSSTAARVRLCRARQVLRRQLESMVLTTGIV